MSLQNFESCSHDSKFDRKMLKVAVMIRNMIANFTNLRSNFIQNQSHVTAFKKKMQSFFKNLPSYL